MDNIYAERIEELRRLMLSKDWDAVVITGSDPHSSEYPAPRWKQVEWLSGFTGEAGDLVITLDHAGLWTDTRYFIQAVQQLEGTGVELHKMRVPGQVGIPEWLGSQFGPDAIVVVDGLCISAEAAAELPCNVISRSIFVHNRGNYYQKYRYRKKYTKSSKKRQKVFVLANSKPNTFKKSCGMD